MPKSHPTSITEASAAVAGLPDTCQVVLAGGREFQVRRLNWMQFEIIWTDLAAVLAALLAAGEDATADELLGSLATAPGVVMKLASLATGCGEPEVAAMSFDDVLAVAGAAIKLNFVDSAGVRSFFSAAAGLAEVAQ